MKFLRNFTLHSTMFLLIRYIAKHCSILYKTLHSTMFLLIRMAFYHRHNEKIIFTFHNVSINTDKYKDGNVVRWTLHSTMFLLILTNFHELNLDWLSLHSTMFLLIPRWKDSENNFGALYIPQCFY